MADGQTVNRIQILRNELFGEIEVIQTTTHTYVAKRLTPKSAAAFERAHKTFPFLFSNEFPFLQEFQAQTELFGATYLLFKYYDFSLQNLIDNNRRAAIHLPENMLLKLLNDLFFAIGYFKNRGLVYPLIHNKTVFVSKTGNLKLTNPLLFEETFVNLERVSDDPQTLLAADRRIGEAAKVVLEQATFANLFGPDVTPTDFQEALRNLRPQYSYDLYNLLRKFDFLGSARVLGESRFQNYNVAENFFNGNCTNVDKYLAGVKVNTMDFEIPKTAAAKVYTIKNGSITKLPDKRSGIFDSQQQLPGASGLQVNNSGVLGNSMPPREWNQAVPDIPPSPPKRIFDNPSLPMGVIDVSPFQRESQVSNSNLRAVSAQPPSPGVYVQSNSQQNFTRKKVEDSFFDDIFERKAQAEVQQPARVSTASEPQPQVVPSQASIKVDDFFDVPPNFQQISHHNLTHNPHSEHNVSASFRQNPFHHGNRDSTGSDARRSKSSSPMEVRDQPGHPQGAPLTSPAPVYIDPNESFSKRLAQFYQQEYQERNESMRESALSQPNQGPRTSGTQDFYKGQLKPGDKSYAVIHDFPVQS